MSNKDSNLTDSIVYAVFTDDGQGLPAYYNGTYSDIDKAVAAGKTLIATDFIVHFDGEYMSLDEVEEILDTFDNHITIHGDNNEIFHIIKTQINIPHISDDED